MSAFVTGGGRGIGRACALALAARGHDVVLFARTEAELVKVADEVRALGRRAVHVAGDVAHDADLRRATSIALEHFGPPDAVVHAAGVVRRALVHEMREEDWDAVVAANLKGAFLVTRALLPSMLARGSGRCVYIASISSTLGTARQSAYCAAKWGVVGFVKSLAEELRGKGLEALAVLPGSVDTAMLVGSGFEPAMSAEQVARTVVFAALDAPAPMNGSAIEMFG